MAIGYVAGGGGQASPAGNVFVAAHSWVKEPAVEIGISVDGFGADEGETSHSAAVGETGNGGVVQERPANGLTVGNRNNDLVETAGYSLGTVVTEE